MYISTYVYIYKSYDIIHTYMTWHDMTWHYMTWHDMTWHYIHTSYDLIFWECFEAISSNLNAFHPIVAPPHVHTHPQCQLFFCIILYWIESFWMSVYAIFKGRGVLQYSKGKALLWPILDTLMPSKTSFLAGRAKISQSMGKKIY